MSSDRSQSGSILPFLALIILTAIILLAFVLDTSRQENTAKDLQSVVDASALAGVTALEPTEDGWKRVKRAVISSLAENLVFSASEHFDGTLRLTSGLSDLASTSPDTENPGNEGTSGSWKLQVERGYYWWNEANTKFEFVSLEVPANVHNLSNLGIAGVQGLPAWEVANAVRVTVTLSNVSTTFAKQLGVNEFGPVARTATASRNKELEYCVAPFAIPACSLLLDTRSDASGAYTLDGYDANMACPRELVFTETLYEVQGRMEGITRSDVYWRPPYVNNDPSTGQLNNKALPIRGILGLPTSYHNTATESNRYATAAELGRFFSNENKGCVKVKLGDGFRPVDSLVQPIATSDTCGTAVPIPGFYNDPTVATQIGALINGTAADSTPDAHPLFRSVFGEISASGDSRKTNFPYLRTQRPDAPVSSPIRDNELRLIWPSEFGGQTSWFGDLSAYTGEIMLAAADPIIINPDGTNRPAGRWTNPMCHSKMINDANNYGSGNSGARVWRTKAAVIAPSDPAADPYCDFARTFSGDLQYLTRPTSSTNPIVVGFVNIDVFDFNINDLTLPNSHDGSSNSTVYFQVAGGSIADPNPKQMRRIFSSNNGIPLFSAMKTYIDDASERAYQNCLNLCSERVPEGGECDPVAECGQYQRCNANQPPYSDYLTCFDYFGVSDPSFTFQGSPSTVASIRDDSNCVRDLEDGGAVRVDICDVLFNGNPRPASLADLCSSNDFALASACMMRSNLRLMLATMAANSWAVDIHVLEKLLEDLSDKPNYIRAAPGYDPHYQPPILSTCDASSVEDGELIQPSIQPILEILKDRDIATCRMYLSLLDLAYAPVIVSVENYVGSRVPGVAHDTPPAPADREQYHCLPMHIPGRFPLDDPRSWDDPRPLSPQYGCGGIRARVQCNNAESGRRSFTNPDGEYRSEPKLVN